VTRYVSKSCIAAKASDIIEISSYSFVDWTNSSNYYERKIYINNIYNKFNIISLFN